MQAADAGMRTYRVTYAHTDEGAGGAESKHGYAMQEVQVDRPITTQADLVEIARIIGNETGYTRVAIMKTELAVSVDDEEED